MRVILCFFGNIDADNFFDILLIAGEVRTRQQNSDTKWSEHEQHKESSKPDYRQVSVANLLNQKFACFQFIFCRLKDGKPGAGRPNTDHPEDIASTTTGKNSKLKPLQWGSSIF